MQSTLYLCVKSLHIISIVAWMAGILYLFRLFVYHVEEKEAVVKSRFEVMEMRLYRFITMPAMGMAFIFGIWLLVLEPSLLRSGWLHAKLLFVAALIGMTHFGGAQIDDLKMGQCKHSSKTFRILNEVPTLLLVVIVFLVVLKPWAR